MSVFGGPLTKEAATFFCRCRFLLLVLLVLLLALARHRGCQSLGGPSPRRLVFLFVVVVVAGAAGVVWQHI